MGLKPVGRVLEPSGPPASRAEVLLGYLDYFRSLVVNKVPGLSDAQLRVSPLPSDWTFRGPTVPGPGNGAPWTHTLGQCLDRAVDIGVADIANTPATSPGPLARSRGRTCVDKLSRTSRSDLHAGPGLSCEGAGSGLAWAFVSTPRCNP